MNETELLAILARGEDSRHQFRENFSNVDSLAAKLVAFSNSGGGMLIVGANDAGEVLGLTAADINRLNQLLSNAASQSVRPPINPISLNVHTMLGLLMVIQTPEGLNRPYTDNQGLIDADEAPVAQATVAEIDHQALVEYFENRYREPLEDTGQSLARLLQNMGLARDSVLTLAGLLLFAKKPERFRPAFMIKSVAIPGRELHETSLSG